jgi:hypothetical protein
MHSLLNLVKTPSATDINHKKNRNWFIITMMAVFTFARKLLEILEKG